MDTIFLGHDEYYHKALAKKENGGLRALRKKKKLIKTHFMHLQDMPFITALTLFKILSVPKIAKDIIIFNRQ